MEHTPREVFISYHTSSCAEIVKQLVNALESAGISCWYAPRNVEGSYASSIINGINECKVFLLVLNKEANLSEHVLNEVNYAFDRFSKHEDITLLPFRIDEFQLNKDITYYLGRIHIMDGGIPPEVLKVKELINRISNILGREYIREETVTEKETGEKKQYRLVDSVEYPDNCFVGRKREIDQMARQFETKQNKLFLVGMGGMGKSEIAKKYCDEYRDRYDVVLWTTYSTDLCQTIINDFTFPIQGLSRSDFPEKTDEEYFQYKVNILKEITDSRVLIIIDNMDVLEDKWLKTFCSGDYSVLFTTRFHALAKNLPELEVQEITDEEEMIEIFRAEYTRDLDDEAMENVKEILQMLNGHPLSIRLVASAMQSGRIKPEKMADLLHNGAAQMKNSNMKASDIIYGRLKQVFSLAALSEEEIFILKNLCLLPVQGIEVEKFYDYCKLDDYDIIDELIQKSWVIHNPATDEVHLHPLVAELMMEELENDLDACNELLRALLAEIPKVDDMTFAKKRQALECYESVSRKLPKNHPQRWGILYGYAVALIHLGSYEKGIESLKTLLPDTEKLEDRLKLINKTAKVYNDLAKPEEAIAEAGKGLEMVSGIPEEKLVGKEGAFKRNLYIRLAEAHRTLQNYDLAEEYMRKTLTNCHIYYDSTPEEEYGWTAMFLARILALKSDEESWEEGARLFEEVIEIFRKMKHQRGQGFGYLFYCQLSMQQRKFDKALEENKKAHDLLVPYVGEVHLNMALVKLYEGNIYRMMGEEEKALPCYRKAKEILAELNEQKMVEKTEQIIASGKVGYIN